MNRLTWFITNKSWINAYAYLADWPISRVSELTQQHTLMQRAAVQYIYFLQSTSKKFIKSTPNKRRFWLGSRTPTSISLLNQQWKISLQLNGALLEEQETRLSFYGAIGWLILSFRDRTNYLLTNFPLGIVPSRSTTRLTISVSFGAPSNTHFFRTFVDRCRTIISKLIRWHVYVL